MIKIFSFLEDKFFPIKKYKGKGFYKLNKQERKRKKYETLEKQLIKSTKRLEAKEKRLKN